MSRLWGKRRIGRAAPRTGTSVRHGPARPHRPPSPPLGVHDGVHTLSQQGSEMNILRRGLPVAIVAAVGMSMTACGGSDSGGHSSDGTTTIRVASNSNSTALPFWVAKDQGFFEDQGLKVEYTKIENIATLPPALGSSFDIVLSTPTLAISSTAQGIPVVEVAGSSVESSENPGSFLMAGPGSGITDVSQMGGKTLGVLNETGTLHVATMDWMKQEGVDLDSVNVVQVDGPAQA